MLLSFRCSTAKPLHFRSVLLDQGNDKLRLTDLAAGAGGFLCEVIFQAPEQFPGEWEGSGFGVVHLLNIHEKDASFPKSKYALFGNHFLKTVASNKILVKGKLYVFSAAAPSAGG